MERKEIMDVADVVALEKRLAAGGTSLATLMERAGGAITDQIRAHFASAPDAAVALKVVILAGSGNNGGDGWVAAKHLAQDGFAVTLVSPRVAADIKAEPAHTAALETLAADLPVSVLVNPADEVLAGELADADTILDAILGTGFDGGEVREPYASWIRAANKAHASHQVFSVAADVPSGLSAQTGAVGSPTFQADVTVTMLAYKPGLLMEQAQPYTGEVLLAPLA